MTKHHRVHIDVELVRRLIDSQFPEWSSLDIYKVEFDGWDNSTYRLGKAMKIRLPTAMRYAGQVEKEYSWLPYLAEYLPYRIPKPLAIGKPAVDFPYQWSIQEWINGETASTSQLTDLSSIAEGLAKFLIALQRIPANGGPLAGPQNFFRGGSLSVYDAQTRQCLELLKGIIDVNLATVIWDEALSTEWCGPKVWLHGDFAPSNILLQKGKLNAIIDFGSCAIGDPACDLVVAWTLLDDNSRHRFQTVLLSTTDTATWARARGWALWKALITILDKTQSLQSSQEAQRIINTIFSEYKNGISSIV